MDAHPVGRASQPAGPDRGRRDRRAQTPVTAAPRAPRSVRSSRARSPRPASARRSWRSSGTRISRRSTSTRIRTRGTIRVRKCSRSRSFSGNPTDGCSARRCWARMALPSGSIPSPWRSRRGCTIYDLEESELSYAPPFGSAKDPVNFAGMVAANILRGDMPLTHWDSVDGAFLLDVRNPPELAVEVRSGRGQYPVAATSLAAR